MRRKLIIGWILLIAGFLLLEVSYIVDMWIIRVLGRVLWPVGMVMGTNASLACDRQKKNNDSFAEQECNQDVSDETND